MKSNYSTIGKYIRIVDERNTADKKDNLLGVSVSKIFIKSIANTVGTDFTTYRVVKKNQFTYIPDTSRRGDKIGIAFLDSVEEGLVSQAYTVFEIADKENLLPEYLMMWFSRPEFDRYARFISHGSVREIFEWEDMCNVSLPIPKPDKQKEIVKEYNTIVNHIALNNQLILKLEETAQAIYKQWFVDFENDEETKIGDLLIPKKGKNITRGEAISGDYPVIAGGLEPSCYHNSFNTKSPVVTISASGANAGYVNLFYSNVWAADCTYIDASIFKEIYFVYVALKVNQSLLMSKQIGTGQPHIYPEHIASIGISNYEKDKAIKFNYTVTPVFEKINQCQRQNSILNKIKDLLLSKLATIEN